MIPVQRTNEPNILKQKSQTWLKELQAAITNLEQVKSNPKPNPQDIQAAQKKVENAQNKYNPGKDKKSGINPVKQPLYDMFAGKCAFCERKVEISTGHIEHFKPKSQYVNLTFDWNNFLYSCEVGNNKRHKGEKFPLDCDDAPLLIDPTDENSDIYQHLDFYWDANTKLASIYGKDGRGKVVEEIFELNRKDLREHRSDQVKKLLIFLKYATDGNQEAIDILKEYCKLDKEYSAFALFYIIPYLAHHLEISEAIDMIKEISKRSQSYAKFARIDDLY
ncbi:MAG: retron system putative HNH endonuclease [Sphaerospermopsis kisseleviana]